MSLATFKKKSIVAHRGTKISGSPPGGIWLTQGPFGSAMLRNLQGNSGFSINGGNRNVGYVGQSMNMGKNGTSYKGIYPRGAGGCCGKYYNAQPVMNSARVNTLGDQYKYIKPSVLSTRGMLRKKYRWAYSGVVPNYWVKQVGGTANLSDNYSSGLYTSNLSAKTDCVVDTNDEDKYVGYVVECGAFGCNKTDGGRYTYNQAAGNAPYSKELREPRTSGQYTARVQRSCILNQNQEALNIKQGTGKCVNIVSRNIKETSV